MWISRAGPSPTTSSPPLPASEPSRRPAKAARIEIITRRHFRPASRRLTFRLRRRGCNSNAETADGQEPDPRRSPSGRANHALGERFCDDLHDSERLAHLRCVAAVRLHLPALGHARRMARGAIAWHFAAMWLLVANGLVYLGYGFLSGYFRRTLLPLRRARSGRIHSTR